MQIIEQKKNKYDGVIIKYSNELARNYTQFTLEEQKALHIIFSHIKPLEVNPTTFRIGKKDFFEKLSLQGHSKYQRYEKIVTSLINKTFTQIIKEDTNSKLIGNVISATEWFFKENYFQVSLSPDFMPYLENLINYYTKLDLDSIVSFKSKYALTLYKFLCSWTDENKNQNQRYLTTKELKELLGLSKEAYMQNAKFNRADFERYTLVKAVKEINEVTSLMVSYKKNKEKNRVSNYEFNWSDNMQKQILLKKK